MKTDAYQNVSNAKKALTPVLNVVMELIAATGPALNVKTKLNALPVNMDSNWTPNSISAFSSSLASQDTARHVMNNKTSALNAYLLTF